MYEELNKFSGSIKLSSLQHVVFCQELISASPLISSWFCGCLIEMVTGVKSSSISWPQVITPSRNSRAGGCQVGGSVA